MKSISVLLICNPILTVELNYRLPCMFAALSVITSKAGILGLTTAGPFDQAAKWRLFQSLDVLQKLGQTWPFAHWIFQLFARLIKNGSNLPSQMSPSANANHEGNQGDSNFDDPGNHDVLQYFVEFGGFDDAVEI